MGRKTKLSTMDVHLVKEEQLKCLNIANSLANHLSRCTADWMEANHPKMESPVTATILNAALLGLMSNWAAQWVDIDKVEEYVQLQAEAIRVHVMKHIELMAAEEDDVAD
jgi:hypothetical protein